MLAIVAFVLPALVAAQAPQSAWGVNELTDYRLTLPVFTQFKEASRLIANVTRDDPRFTHAPLFTKEVVLSGELQEMAIALEARLTHDPPLASALRDGGMTPHDYTKFALILFAARFAHGFVESGVLRTTFGGVAGENVKFVDAHKTQVVEVLMQMGVE